VVELWLVTQYKKFVPKNVKFHHIVKFYTCSGTSPQLYSYYSSRPAKELTVDNYITWHVSLPFYTVSRKIKQDFRRGDNTA